MCNDLKIIHISGRPKAPWIQGQVERQVICNEDDGDMILMRIQITENTPYTIRFDYTIQWFLNDSLISCKAAHFAEELQLSNFKNSNGFLAKFKKRHGFRMLKLHGEMRTDKVVDINSFREEFKEISKSYKPDLIYNLDETALYYKLIPSKSVCRNRFQGYKNFKDRVSIMLCSNMTGSHKLKPVMIGKPKMPRCFKNFDYGCLVSYYSSQKAWMTGSIFIDWIISFDLQLKLKRRKFYC
ncbi:jerky protein homolog-like [Octopus sinensis]|uniref:Jerky protein homolog-like n=1 Tax=Octopus sinensis TaxID=2607531 RepID=A0A6P7U208_9MOLL|nr:jerky protein homolog-like [Octopus sinensis]